MATTYVTTDDLDALGIKWTDNAGKLVPASLVGRHPEADARLAAATTGVRSLRIDENSRDAEIARNIPMAPSDGKAYRIEAAVTNGPTFALVGTLAEIDARLRSGFVGVDVATGETGKASEWPMVAERMRGQIAGMVAPAAGRWVPWPYATPEEREAIERQLNAGSLAIDREAARVVPAAEPLTLHPSTHIDAITIGGLAVRCPTVESGSPDGFTLSARVDWETCRALQTAWCSAKPVAIAAGGLTRYAVPLKFKAEKVQRASGAAFDVKIEARWYVEPCYSWADAARDFKASGGSYDVVTTGGHRIPRPVPDARAALGKIAGEAGGAWTIPDALNNRTITFAPGPGKRLVPTPGRPGLFDVVDAVAEERTIVPLPAGAAPSAAKSTALAAGQVWAADGAQPLTMARRVDGLPGYWETIEDGPDGFKVNEGLAVKWWRYLGTREPAKPESLAAGQVWARDMGASTQRRTLVRPDPAYPNAWFSEERPDHSTPGWTLLTMPEWRYLGTRAPSKNADLAAGQVWQFEGREPPFELVRRGDDPEKWETRWREPGHQADGWRHGEILAYKIHPAHGARYLGTREETAARERAACVTASGERMVAKARERADNEVREEAARLGVPASESIGARTAHIAADSSFRPGTESWFLSILSYAFRTVPIGAFRLDESTPGVVKVSAPQCGVTMGQLTEACEALQQAMPIGGASVVAWNVVERTAPLAVLRATIDALIAADHGPFAHARAAALRCYSEPHPEVGAHDHKSKALLAARAAKAWESKPRSPKDAGRLHAALLGYEAARGGAVTPANTPAARRAADLIEPHVLATYERERARSDVYARPGSR